MDASLGWPTSDRLTAGGTLTDAQALTIGIEEEYLLTDAASGELVPAGEDVLEVAHRRLGERAQPELLACQVETATDVCTTLADAELALRGMRRSMLDAAERAGVRPIAAASHPFGRWEDQAVTRKERYQGLLDSFAQVARETVICGCHVHVGVEDADARIAALARLRAWLAVPLALSASSPFWEGEDTGYASYRTTMFRRWPLSGLAGDLEGWAGYQALVGALVRAGAVEDGTKIYWDVRPSWRFPTLEVRVADVCQTVEEALALAGLLRALVVTALADELPGALMRAEVADAGVRRAARFGLRGSLLDPVEGTLAPAPEVTRRVLAWCRPALEAAGDAERVEAAVGRILADGNGADRQRAAFAGGGFPAVVDLLWADFGR
jgi:carboxylate-amine ligase